MKTKKKILIGICCLFAVGFGFAVGICAVALFILLG
jgi:hypothetical protein